VSFLTIFNIIIILATMSSRSSGRANGQSHEDQTAEMISNLTMTQLLYILQRIRQLSFHSQEYAKKLLTESPQLCLALIHAQYIVSGKKLDSHLLPLTADEIKMSHDRLNLIRMMDANPNAHMGVIGSGSSAPADVGLSRKFSTQHGRSAGDQASELSRLLAGLDPAMLERVIQGVSGGEKMDQETVAESLMNLSPEQIAALPEIVQRQVLKLLEESLAV